MPDAESTEQWGRRWAPFLEPGMVISFAGTLGAGKTSLIRGILRGLGVTGSIKSPTYALLETYLLSRLYCYHFDFYRISNSYTAEEGEFRECFREDSLCLIEWPEKVVSWLPPVDVAWGLEIQGSGRILRVLEASPRGMKCLESMLDFYSSP
ncbi:MAG: tRNA (adenosine(37)-N6)-threonylcarbamoyltransferase complex ATPase subunit type 1 TsaE [Ferrovum sp.]|nr:tRNA (adenosine(37)-N6)-threonylcarbamoyltransferase complex ATPase subunit type 1 TsaE [Ferrovum sp.]NDU86828.1 tRNA (adenosine(37)-N6)-threonylcarbamoyltransferase complex ATPase subunit type 1 TsaE [Ferrovum sp.]